MTQPGSPSRGTGSGGRTMEIVHEGRTLVLTGDFDVRSTMEVRTAIHEHLYGADQDLVIDLSGVGTLDSTAARVLAYATLEAGRSGQHLRLRGCGPAVRRMLHLTRLARFVEVERAAATA
jgi:anti-anti-sigma factor